MLAAARVPRFIVHGQAGSWIKYGVDAQERLLVAALTPEGAAPKDEGERATLVDGMSGTENEMAIPRGDYRQFYMQLRDALNGAGGNPVPPEHVLPVIAVLEAAIRSSAEGRTMTLPLTEAEILAFTRGRSSTRSPT